MICWRVWKKDITILVSTRLHRRLLFLTFGKFVCLKYFLLSNAKNQRNEETFIERKLSIILILKNWPNFILSGSSFGHVTRFNFVFSDIIWFNNFHFVHTEIALSAALNKVQRSRHLNCHQIPMKFTWNHFLLSILNNNHFIFFFSLFFSESNRQRKWIEITAN